MSTNLFYFTSTGNTLKIARDIAAELGDAKLISIPNVMKTGEVDLSADKIGIIFPVYMWGLPAMVREFVKKLGSAKGKYLFSVVTYGGAYLGTHLQLDRLLKENGLELSGGFSVKMPGNYTPLYGAIAEEKQKKLFENARSKVKSIAEGVRFGVKGKVDKGFFLLNWLMSGVFYNFSMPHIRENDKKFMLENSCTGCAICEKLCPARNIKLVEGKPQWLHKCEHCMGCLQWCPVEAIQFGSSKGKKRYHHPEVRVEDICC